MIDAGKHKEAMMFCSKCGKSIEGSPEYCAHCGAQVAQATSKPKKSNRTRNIVIGIVGVFLALFAVIAIYVFGGQGGVSDTSGLPQNLKVGQSAQTSEQKVTVISVDRVEEDDWYPGETWVAVIIQVQVQNVGASSLWVSNGDFSLSDSEGNRCGSCSGVNSPGNYNTFYFSSLKQLYEGEKEVGVIEFGAPTSATGLEMAYNFGDSSGQTLARWRLD